MVGIYSYGTFEENDFTIGSTSANEYFPVYSLFSSDNDNAVSCSIVGTVKCYHKPLNQTSKGYDDYNRYADFHSVFNSCLTPVQFGFTYDGEAQGVTCTKGYVASKADEILLLLTTNNAEIFDDNEQLICENLRLYVSTELSLNPIYKNLYKKIDAEIIQYCYLNDIEVVFTLSKKIEKATYSNDFNLEFTNFTELNNHLNSGIGAILFFDETAFIQEHNLNPLFIGTDSDSLYEDEVNYVEDEPPF